ncbi:hypothetical protein [Nesterenkonia flava]|uniref:Uncharacterized protein n=1 Tax=Nesterenkonia flava TaxID=469799 RepID=A0ABU1FUD9_9MICC|nr:hypothetical protein [Nesterenkonia flava]MDR5712288.1 hypothetical protein [Nesterenkonia flava]
MPHQTPFTRKPAPHPATYLWMLLPVIFLSFHLVEFFLKLFFWLTPVALTTWIGHLGLLHLGANMVARDLDAQAPVFSGVWGNHFVVGIALIGVLTVIAQTLRQGKQAQDELEGLV